MHEGNGGSMPPGGGGGAGFKVNKENVLQMAKETQDTAQWLYEEVRVCEADIRMEPARLDPVSKDVAKVLNGMFADNADSYVQRGYQYVRTLEDAVAQMKAAAKDYGYTDAEITTALAGEGNPNA
ncbi:PE domain-containing protein [Crossiella cryophila]|uniref:DNA-binding phage protein n=1 Tax=Crossiella cryophila TaxID=43355 RepID=A0A7W7FYM2_9PSEU|nr:PE domain-containing protein [Crossiella cryophila]MBB4681803.1 DNA-binding phage protein [Crossiella cryophila]